MGRANSLEKKTLMLEKIEGLKRRRGQSALGSPMDLSLASTVLERNRPKDTPLLQPANTLQLFFQLQPLESATQLSMITRTSHHFLSFTPYYRSTMSSQICQIYSTDMETAAHHPVNQRLGVSGLLHVPLWASTSTATTWLWRMWAASFCQLVKNCEGSKQL